MTAKALADIPLFASLSMPALDGLLRRSRAEVLEPGAVAARQGDPAEALLVVQRGSLAAVYDTVDGRRVRFGTFAAPCAVDKVALLDGGTHTATWEALETTQIRRIARHHIATLVDDLPSVRRHVMRHLAGEARRHQSARVLASTASATTRAACWLVEQMSGSETLIDLPRGGQQALGEPIGASRITTNRSLQALVGEGLIRLEAGGRVRVLRPELLAARASVV